MRDRPSLTTICLALGFGAAIILVILTGCSTKAQRLYQRAEAFFAQGQYELAAREYHRIVTDAPRDSLADDAWYKLAYLYREELDYPGAALTAYREIADNYENSNYVDESLFWTVYLQRWHLRDPEAAGATCRELDRRFPDRKQLRGSAHLQAIGALVDSGRLTEAGELCQRIVGQFKDHPAIAAQALLVLAEIADQAGKDPSVALKLYEQLIDNYPDTPAASAARQVVGLKYWDLKTEEEQTRLAAQREQARLLRDVPPFEEYPGQPAMELLAAVHSTLRCADVKVSLEQVVVASGLPFTFTFNLDRPELAQTFYRNPTVAVAEQMGFGYNLWTSSEQTEVLENVTSSLLRGQPLLVAYGAPAAHWCLIVGYRPAEGELYLLQPGAQQPTKLAPERFAEVWRTGEVPALWAQGRLSEFQFALTTRRTPTETTAVVRSVLAQAILIWDQEKLMEQPNGSAAFEKLIEVAEEAVDPADPAVRQHLNSWVKAASPLLVSSRRAAARFFADPPEDFAQQEVATCQVAAQRYGEIATIWKLLAEQMRQAGAVAPETEAGEEESANRRRWQQALDTVRKLADLERGTLRWLASTLTG